MISDSSIKSALSYHLLCSLMDKGRQFHVVVHTSLVRHFHIQLPSVLIVSFPHSCYAWRNIILPEMLIDFRGRWLRVDFFHYIRCIDIVSGCQVLVFHGHFHGFISQVPYKTNRSMIRAMFNLKCITSSRHYSTAPIVIIIIIVVIITTTSSCFSSCLRLSASAVLPPLFSFPPE